MPLGIASAVEKPWLRGAATGEVDAKPSSRLG
jgi:hypothetical protein